MRREKAMAYEEKSVQAGDPERIDVNQHGELQRWCKKLKCTEEELRFVVKYYGVVAKDIQAFFERCRY
jgi:hypothetical protein